MSHKGRQWLRQELPLWEREGLIDPQQAVALSERYRLDELEEGGFWRHLISGAGAILIGLGVILLFAYNWEAMGKPLKLAVIFSALLLAHGGGYLTLERNCLLSEGLFAIGSMLLGAGIFLVGQIYHLNSHYPDALLLWALGVLVLAWALPSRIQAWMALILVMVWHLAEVIDFNRPNEWVFLPLGLLLPLVWRLGSPLLARFSSLVLLVTVTSILLLRDYPASFTVLLSLTLVLVALPALTDALNRPALRPLAEAMAAPGITALVVLMMVLSIENQASYWLWGWAYEELAHPLSLAVMGLSQILVLTLLWRLRRLDALLWVAEGIWLLIIVPDLVDRLAGNEGLAWIGGVQLLLINLLTLGLSLWMMISGAREVNRRRLVWGALLFALLVVLRYLDLFDSLIARGLVFLLLGIGLFALSHWYRRNKREAAP